MFNLSQLLEYQSIVIQCHDNPDADTISSAFALQVYLEENGKSAPIIYSGRSLITKSNLRLLVDRLNIEIQHVSSIDPPDLLICVDCQYGEGNVTRFEAKNVAVIDHHLQTGEIALGTVFSGLGSCATLMWELLFNAGFDVAENKNVATALYYGLFTDTNSLAEINHPLDKDMRDELIEYCDAALINQLKNCNLTMDELEIAGVALIRNVNDTVRRYAVFKAESCDQNILGFISDLCLQVDTVDLCVVYNVRRSDARLSVRSCSREVMASEFASFLTDGVGSGGGRPDKAGGYIKLAEIDELDMDIDEYIKFKTTEYYASFDVIDAANHNIDVSGMKKYKKRAIPKGFVVSSDVFDEGTPLMIRSLEGDAHTKASQDIYLMIGILGETYPITKEKFDMTYNICDLPVDLEDDIYTPTAKNELSGETKEIIPFMKSCIAKSEAAIYAAPLERNVKVFTRWNLTGYMFGKTGDYLALNCADINDVYIVEKNIFGLTYEPL